MCFDPVPAIFFIVMGQRICTFTMSFIKDSLSVFISSKIVWIDKLDYFHDGIYFPNFGHHRKKRQFLSYHSNGCYEKKDFFKNHHCRKWVDWITVR